MNLVYELAPPKANSAFNLNLVYELAPPYDTGSILIAVNPFQKLPHLYNQHMMDQYQGVQLGGAEVQARPLRESSPWFSKKFNVLKRETCS